MNPEPIFEKLVAANRALPPRAPMVPAPPRLAVTVVMCMDARIVPLNALGLDIGDAHVLRNAGGRVTEDVLRSLAVSCGLYDVREVAVLHHTDCGMLRPETELREGIAAAAGHEAPAELGVISDPAGDLAADVERLRSCPFLPDDLRVWGLRYDVATGRLDIEVPA